MLAIYFTLFEFCSQSILWIWSLQETASWHLGRLWSTPRRLSHPGWTTNLTFHWLTLFDWNMKMSVLEGRLFDVKRRLCGNAFRTLQRISISHRFWSLLGNWTSVSSNVSKSHSHATCIGWSDSCRSWQRCFRGVEGHASAAWVCCQMFLWIEIEKLVFVNKYFNLKLLKYKSEGKEQLLRCRSLSLFKAQFSASPHAIFSIKSLFLPKRRKMVAEARKLL